jgi:hypothetical protein
MAGLEFMNHDLVRLKTAHKARGDRFFRSKGLIGRGWEVSRLARFTHWASWRDAR